MTVAYAGADLSAAARSSSVPPRLERRWIAGGDLGAKQTLQEMRSLARAALLDPVVLNAAAAIVQDVPGRDEIGQVAALRAWLADRLRFLRDPLGVELVRMPRHLLDTMACQGFAQGDCDDVATLAAALGLAIGLPARFVAVGFGGARGALTHVWTELGARGRWLEVDVTRPVQALPYSRRLIWEV